MPRKVKPADFSHPAPRELKRWRDIEREPGQVNRAGGTENEAGSLNRHRGRGNRQETQARFAADEG
jgi:hypothetical protein